METVLKQILNELGGMRSDMGDLKSDMSNLKSDVRSNLEYQT